MKHLKKKSALAAALALGMSLFGSASADTIDGSVEFVYNVDPSCLFQTNDSQIVGSASFLPGVGFMQQNAVSGYLTVHCNQGVAYTIETDAGAGGEVILFGDATAGSIPAYLFQGGQGDDGSGGIAYGTPFSSDANGEAIVSVATGDLEQIQYSVAFNTDATGTVALPVPPADNYSANVNFTFTY